MRTRKTFDPLVIVGSGWELAGGAAKIIGTAARGACVSRLGGISRVADGECRAKEAFEHNWFSGSFFESGRFKGIVRL